MSSSRSRIIGCLCALALLLGGCSTLRFAYNQAPQLSYWRIDSYLDVNEAQAPQLRAALADWYRWHRASELPGYARLLARLRAEAPEPATAAQVCGWFDEARARFDRAVAQAIPAAAELALTVTPQQIAHLERKHRKLNDEFTRDFLQPDPEARRAAHAKRVVERAEDFYGRLDHGQRQRIAEAVAHSPVDAERLFAERVARQQAVVRMLRRVVAERPPAAQVEQMLRMLVAQLHRSPREAHAGDQQRLREFNCGFVADIHNAMTPAQRAHAAGKLQGYEDDVRALAAASPEAATAAAW